MNFYTITFRLDSDPRSSKRYWEGFADSKESAISILCIYSQTSIFNQSEFEGIPTPGIQILRMDEYLSVFK